MKNSLVLVVLFIVFLSHRRVSGDLKVGFYNSTCPQAEAIIFDVVQTTFSSDPGITGALLRMHFHDCFVNGCDASLLIDSTPAQQSEKDAGPNPSVRGHDVIDTAKEALESACPSTVSCADIITLATRDSVALAGGPNYDIPTGQLDGLVSNPNDVVLPGPTSSVAGAFQTFSAKGFTLNEMVTLLGAHTVGVAHCSNFLDRLNGRDPIKMNSSLVTKLKKLCKKRSASDPTAFLDQNTSFVFDNEYYNQLKLKKGVLHIDQALASDTSSAGIVSSFASDGVGFKLRFAEAMVKLGSLVNDVGNIRLSCRTFN